MQLAIDPLPLFQGSGRSRVLFNFDLLGLFFIQSLVRAALQVFLVAEESRGSERQFKAVKLLSKPLLRLLQQRKAAPLDCRFAGTVLVVHNGHRGQRALP